jgi:hypothetical protein
MALEKAGRIGSGEGGHVLGPADHRLVVGVVQECQCVHLFAPLRGGAVVDARVALFGDDLELAGGVRLVDLKVRKAVGFHGHHACQMLLADRRVVERVIAGGEGILGTTDTGNRPVIHAFGEIFGAGEHEMFEVMGKAGFAIRVIPTSGFDDQQMRDDGNAVVGHDHDREAIAQVKALDGNQRAHIARFDGAPAIKINHRREDREAEYEGNEIAP